MGAPPIIPSTPLCRPLDYPLDNPLHIPRICLKDVW